MRLNYVVLNYVVLNYATLAAINYAIYGPWP